MYCCRYVQHLAQSGPNLSRAVRCHRRVIIVRDLSLESLHQGTVHMKESPLPYQLVDPQVHGCLAQCSKQAQGAYRAGWALSQRLRAVCFPSAPTACVPHRSGQQPQRDLHGELQPWDLDRTPEQRPGAALPRHQLRATGRSGHHAACPQDAGR